ncbi:DinB family protein [Solibacillus silvestris]|uniref:DinB family protein n=1 Tax=Solibacillus silvestris TaxID=76853 RepID=UPI003F7E6E67
MTESIFKSLVITILYRKITLLEVVIILKEKFEIIRHQKNFLTFIQSLEKLNEDVLRTPIHDGKWSVIEIIGHFYPWDEFVLKKRIPYLLTNSELPPSPNADLLNLRSVQLVRNEDIPHTIKKCIRIRTELIETLNELPEEDWLAELKINQSTLSLYSYFKGLMEHDVHHMKQIKSYLGK